MRDLNNGELELNRIYHGDCFNFLPLMKEKSVDMIFTDLPFGTTQAKWDKPLDLDKLWSQYERVIKDNGAILLFAQAPFDKVLAASNLKMFRYEWVWEKTHATGHLNSKKMPMKAHEQVLVFYKNLPTYNPQKTSGHKLKSVKVTSRKSIESTIYNKHDRHVDYASTERYPRSVVKFASDRQKLSLHETQKPEKLLEYFIRTYSNEGDVVLDTCAGSGSLAAACINSNRRFICMEKDEYHYNVSVERIAGIQEKE
ncbi:DNA-methyltransferase [Pontibacter virosus]|uniref:Methyltransferase n=1 Tax=Pontibacter virosus TaxID=1765052 RepID=A0A2U1B3S5_9BACT|nr:site-specific DNA-methyltransferase [Pontibacter virosus]PVY43167.1 site-specific DNA-methyltransferase (adenine-specific) [Pontibacter virosus]